MTKLVGIQPGQRAISARTMRHTCATLRGAGRSAPDRPVPPSPAAGVRPRAPAAPPTGPRGVLVPVPTEAKALLARAAHPSSSLDGPALLAAIASGLAVSASCPLPAGPDRTWEQILVSDAWDA